MFRKFTLLAFIIFSILVLALPVSADVETNGIVTPVGYWLAMATATPPAMLKSIWAWLVLAHPHVLHLPVP